MGFLKKLETGANKFFKKVDKGANNAFKKIGKGINDAGDWAENAVDKVAGVGKQVGNYLEKNAGNIAAGAAGIAAGVASATGVGAGLAPMILAGGAAAQQAGSRLKNASQNTQMIKDKIGGIRDKAAGFNNSLDNTVKGALNQGRTTSQNMINQAQNNVNKLGQQIDTMKMKIV